VPNLIVQEVDCLEDCIRLFEAGSRRRPTARTNRNEHSSRSHALFTVMVEQSDSAEDASSPVCVSSKINVVDLAGSEVIDQSGVTGDALGQAQSINLSLSLLSRVMRALVGRKPHVPYRDSPLTQLLMDSLGGHSKTVMFATIAPSIHHVRETISTLRFAGCAKKIENQPVKNFDPGNRPR
jgi:kinesin family protein 3/17